MLFFYVNKNWHPYVGFLQPQSDPTSLFNTMLSQSLGTAWDLKMEKTLIGEQGASDFFPYPTSSHMAFSLATL